MTEELPCILLTKQLKYSVEGASKKDKKLNNRIIRFKINDTLSLKSNGKIIIDQSPVSDKLPFNTPVVYLNKNDEIIILEKVQHWYRIEYKNGNKINKNVMILCKMIQLLN
jgi:hypothetical protein